MFFFENGVDRRAYKTLVTKDSKVYILVFEYLCENSLQIWTGFFLNILVNKDYIWSIVVHCFVISHFFRFYLVSKLMEDEKLFYCYKFTEILEPMNFFIKNKLKVWTMH